MKEKAPLIEVIAQTAALWIFSDFGYYMLRSVLGRQSASSAHPFLLTFYYLFWVGVVLILFKESYKAWKVAEHRPSLYVTIFILGGIIASYLVYILPNFPPLRWNPVLKPATELLVASPWYFLPKSMEILLQQLLIVALARAFITRGFTLRASILWCAALFTSMHLLLIVSGASAMYVLIFTSAAAVAGVLFPYLILRVKNGFVYSYFLHWTFYAVLIVMMRLLLPV